MIRNPTGDLPIGKTKFDQPNNKKVTLRLCEHDNSLVKGTLFIF